MAKEVRVRKFEVVSSINLGKGNLKTPGDTILETEIDAKDLAQFLGQGKLRDGDAPIPPSQAEGVVAFDRLLSVAKKIGIVTQDGGEYTFGKTTAKGLSAFREAVSIDELETAIVKAAAR